jgi:hypothetical protein
MTLGNDICLPLHEIHINNRTKIKTGATLCFYYSLEHGRRVWVQNTLTPKIEKER